MSQLNKIIEAFLESRPEDANGESISIDAEVDELDGEDRDRIDGICLVSLIVLTMMSGTMQLLRWSQLCKH